MTNEELLKDTLDAVCRFTGAYGHTREALERIIQSALQHARDQPDLCVCCDRHLEAQTSTCGECAPSVVEVRGRPRCLKHAGELF